MIIAPDGFERFPPLVSALLIPDFAHVAGVRNEFQVGSGQAAKESALDSGMAYVRERPNGEVLERSGTPSHPFTSNLIGGSTLSAGSVSLLAGSIQNPPTAAMVAGLYERVSALPPSPTDMVIG